VIHRRSVRCASLLLFQVLISVACHQRAAASVDAGQIFTDPIAAQLATAAAAGDTERIRRLINDGANPNAVGDKGTSLLQWAMLHRSTAGVEALLSEGADATHADAAGETVMHYAAKANDPAYLDLLLAHGVDVDLPNTHSGVTPLMSALMGNRDAQFQRLLTAGANPNLADRVGNTSLHVAAKIGQSERVLDLLEAHADPDARNRQGANFQRYLEMTPANLLTPEARQRRERIATWLREHEGIAKQ